MTEKCKSEYSLDMCRRSEDQDDRLPKRHAWEVLQQASVWEEDVRNKSHTVFHEGHEGKKAYAEKEK